VASIIGTKLGLTVVVIPMVVSTLLNTKLALAVFSATFNVMKNKMTGNKSNKNFIDCLLSIAISTSQSRILL
jgi:hypothetical protein